MPIVRLPGGELRDEIRLPLYDTISKGNNDAATINTVTQFYSSVAGKAKWETNLSQNNLLETAVSFRVQGMAMDANYQALGAAPFPNALANIQQFSSVRVRIGEKDYWEGPMVYLSGRIDQNAAVNSGGAGAINILHQRFGQLAVQGVILNGRHVVDINPLQSFFAEMTTLVPAALVASCVLAAGEKIYFTFSFKGLKRRPVQ